MPVDDRRRSFHPHSSVRGAAQDDRRSSDINQIVAQYQRSGTLPAVSRSEPLYGDFTLIGDDLMALTEQFQAAKDRFFELPSSVRAAADNDWRQFVLMFEDDDGRALLLDAGLRVIDPAAAPTAAVPVSAPVPAPVPAPAPAAPTAAAPASSSSSS